ncbi:MAG: hypothetical protein WA975_15980 [Mesorhizobium sp.]
MRPTVRKRIFLTALAGAVLAAAHAAPALAWSRHHDRVYADSFGNLVIESAAGYKRIIVGEGSLAKELAAYTATHEPHVEYLEGTSGSFAGADCYRPPAFVKGRSYMYGLSDGEMPQLSPCR